MKVTWSDDARNSYDKTIDDILDRWNPEIAIKLEKLVDNLIYRLEHNNKLCPATHKDRGLRKCVISKQTSVYYRITTNIAFVAFIDNRTDHKY